MSEVKSVSFVLENCEVLTFDREYIGAFCVDGITNTISRIACNSIRKQQHCEKLYLALRRDADQQYDCFGHPSEDTAFKRIDSCPDITSIEITYEDGTTETCFVPWHEEDEYINRYQHSYISEMRDLYLYICKYGDVFDVFHKTDIDDPDIDDSWGLWAEC